VANDSTLVQVATGGLVAVGPTTADAPTSSASVLDTDLVEVGYIGEEGITEARARSTTPIKAFQAGATVRVVVTDSTFTQKFVMIESSAISYETFYGSSVQDADATDGRIDVDPSSTGGRKSWVVDITDGTFNQRTYIPSGEVTEVGDVVYKGGQAVGREVTVTGYPVDGVTASIWSTALASA
jgi:hypothetical protein